MLHQCLRLCIIVTLFLCVYFKPHPTETSTECPWLCCRVSLGWSVSRNGPLPQHPPHLFLVPRYCCHFPQRRNRGAVIFWDLINSMCPYCLLFLKVLGSAFSESISHGVVSVWRRRYMKIPALGCFQSMHSPSDKANLNFLRCPNAFLMQVCDLCSCHSGSLSGIPG